MKRVLCVVSSLNAGGAETILMKIFRQLDRTKYTMDFVVNAPGVYDEEVRALGGQIYTIPLRTKHPFKSFSALLRIVRENKYRCFLKMSDTPVAITDVLAARLGGAKRITVRSCNASSNSSSIAELIYSVLRPAFNAMIDCKIAPSRLAAEYTFGKGQVKKGKVHALHNGVDLNVYAFCEESRGCIRNELHLQDKLVVGHVGRFSRQKNHAFLLEVFAEIKKQTRNAVLLLVGDGERRAEITDKANALGLLDSIIFTGVRRDVPKLLSAMDVFVFPSFYEGMPNTVIEAQATGLPCVISDTITPEADITGLVEYLSLSYSPEHWARTAIRKCTVERKQTADCFTAKGYDISSVKDEFISLIFGCEDHES